MNTHEMWQQAMQPGEAEVLCMSDAAVYRRWMSDVRDDKCPFCGHQVVVRKVTVCANPACLFKTVTYSVLMSSVQTDSA